MKPILYLAVFLILTACSSLGHLSQGVKPVTSDTYVFLEKESTYTVKRGVGYLWKEGLQGGIYKPELENEFGTFFRGPPHCVIQFLEENSMGPFDGGIWIPKDRVNGRPMIYYYFNYHYGRVAQAGGPLAIAIAELSKGEINIVPAPAEKTFLDDVVVTNLPLK